MKVNKFEGLSRGLIKVELDNKCILIRGELTLNKFYAEISSIINWEYPHNNVLISDNERKEIIKAIEEYSKNGEIPIVFE